jgi:hypothetical protein
VPEWPEGDGSRVAYGVNTGGEDEDAGQRGLDQDDIADDNLGGTADLDGDEVEVSGSLGEVWDSLNPETDYRRGSASQPEHEYQSANRFSQSLKLTTQSQFPADYSVRLTQAESGENTDKSAGKIIDFAEVSARLLTSQRETDYDAKRWKRSRLKTGWLIKRIKGHNIVESEYGVQYLYVLSRKPDRTSADVNIYPAAQFCNWEALTEAGRLVKEKVSERKQRRG